jgi:hypothetical protein
MEWLGVDTETMKDGFVFINPAHITSNNLTGTNTDLDRYWYHYAQKMGVEFTNVTQYFRFDKNGVVGASEIMLEAGANYSFRGSGVAFPGMLVPITIVPDPGYALTSILVDGQEQIRKVEFNEDGSVTLQVRCTGGDQKISAVAEAATDGKKTLSGKLNLGGVLGNSTEGVIVSYIGPLGEKPVTLDAQGNFELKDLDPGYYVLKVEKDGYMGFTDGLMLLCEKTRTDAAVALAEKLGVEEKEFVIAVYGDGVTDGEKAEFVSRIEKQYRDVEVFGIDGGQEVYDFLLILE